MIINPFGFLGKFLRQSEQIPNKEKSKKQIQSMKKDLNRKTHTQLKEGKKRSEHISAFHHQNR